MSAQWLYRCPCGAVHEREAFEHFARVTCDAPDCKAVVSDRFGWGSGGEIQVPPGWTRVAVDVRTREANGDTMTSHEWHVRHYCPAHTDAAIAAATRGAATEVCWTSENGA